jgi:hypothetical protein
LSPSKRAKPFGEPIQRKPSAVCANPSTELFGKPSSDCHERISQPVLISCAEVTPNANQSQPANSRWKYCADFEWNTIYNLNPHGGIFNHGEKRGSVWKKNFTRS